MIGVRIPVTIGLSVLLAILQACQPDRRITGRVAYYPDVSKCVSYRGTEVSTDTVLLSLLQTSVGVVAPDVWITPYEKGLITPWSPLEIRVPDSALDRFSLLFVRRTDSVLVAAIQQTCPLHPPVVIPVESLRAILSGDDYRLLVYHDRTLIGEERYVFVE